MLNIEKFFVEKKINFKLIREAAIERKVSERLVYYLNITVGIT